MTDALERIKNEVAAEKGAGWYDFMLMQHEKNCGEQYVSHTDFSAWYDPEDAVDSAVNMDDWHRTKEEKHYCPNCFEVDDNDEVKIKAKQI